MKLFVIQSGVDPAPSNPGVSVKGNGLCTSGLCGLVANSANSVKRFTSGGTSLLLSSLFSSFEEDGGSITRAGGMGFDERLFDIDGGSKTTSKEDNESIAAHKKCEKALGKFLALNDILKTLYCVTIDSK